MNYCKSFFKKKDDNKDNIESEEQVSVGAEATITKVTYKDNKVFIKKARVPKRYRVVELDSRIRKKNTKAEVKNLTRAKQVGVNVPNVVLFTGKLNVSYDASIYFLMDFMSGYMTLKKFIEEDTLNDDVVENLGVTLGLLHSGKIIHGDLTTNNILIKNDSGKYKIALIDFGLSFFSESDEDRSVDLYVLKKSMAVHFELDSVDYEHIFLDILKIYNETVSYKANKPFSINARLKKVEMRGRKKDMVG